MLINILRSATRERKKEKLKIHKVFTFGAGINISVEHKHIGKLCKFDVSSDIEKCSELLKSHIINSSVTILMSAAFV